MAGSCRLGPSAVIVHRSVHRVVASGIRKRLQRIVGRAYDCAIVGISSANLGLLFIVGFIFGDFFLYHISWTEVGWRRDEGFFENVIKVRIPLLIEYGLLYILMVKIPMVTKALTAQLRVPFLPLKASFSIAAALYTLITGVLVYFWTHTVPVLIRPVFTWVSSSPPSQATVPLQQYEWVVIFVAVIMQPFECCCRA